MFVHLVGTMNFNKDINIRSKYATRLFLSTKNMIQRQKCKANIEKRAIVKEIPTTLRGFLRRVAIQ